MKFLCGKEGQIMQARLGFEVPSMKSVAYSADYLSPPGLPKVNTQLFLDAMKYARPSLMLASLEFARIVEERITKSIQMGQETPMQSARAIKAKWLAELDSPLRKTRWGPMRWKVIVSIAATFLLAVMTLLIWRARKERLGPIDRAQQRAGWIFIMPWLIGFLFLALGPIFSSLLLSFSRWSALVPLSQAESVGVGNYYQILLDSSFYKSLRVTLYFVVLAVPIGQMAALAVAMLMNTKGARHRDFPHGLFRAFGREWGGAFSNVATDF